MHVNRHSHQLQAVASHEHSPVVLYHALPVTIDVVQRQHNTHCHLSTLYHLGCTCRVFHGKHCQKQQNMSKKCFHNHYFLFIAYKITKKEWINQLYSLILHIKLKKNGKKAHIHTSCGMFFSV